MPVGLITTITTPPSAGGDLQGDIKTSFVAGLTERGDTVNPIITRSFAEFVDLCGNRVSYGALYDDAQTFFAEAGQVPCRYVVVRSVGTGATKGFFNLADALAQPTLKVYAKDEGPWSAGITVEVQAGTVTNTFTLLVTYNGVTEKYPNLATPAAAVLALAVSGIVRGQDLGSATAPPANNPAVVSPQSLSAGLDDRVSVNAATHLASLNRIPADMGPGLVSIPGQPHSAVAAGLAAFAVAGRIAVTAPPVGTSYASAMTIVRSLRSTPNGERLGFAFPWVTIPDGAGGTRLISPEGFIAGRRVATIDEAGPWQPPAGHYGGAKFATGVELALTAAQTSALADEGASPIRLSANGPRLADWRSVSNDEVTYRFLSVMDLLNDIAFECDKRLEEFEMLTVDGRAKTLTHVYNEMKDVVGPIAAAGGLYAKPNGTPPDPGYRIDIGPTVNSEASLQTGQVRVAVAVRPPGVAELIRLFLTPVTLTADL